MKKVLKIFGAGVLASLGVFLFLNRKKKNKDNSDIPNDNNLGEESSDKNVSIMNFNESDTYEESLKNEKASAVETMHDRHKQASSVIKDTVDIIYSNTEIHEDEDHDLDQLSDELDKLLSED